jgi:hypothetical protein
LRFYAKHGYTPDEIDPTRILEERGDDEWEQVGSDPEEEDEGNVADYRILSKTLPGG